MADKLTAEIFHSENMHDAMFYMTDGSIYNRSQAIASFKEGKYKMVGCFEVPDDSMDSLEYVYCMSQNIDRPWRKGNPCRSTSVGDIVKIGENLFIVAGCGFEKLGPKGE